MSSTNPALPPDQQSAQPTHTSTTTSLNLPALSEVLAPTSLADPPIPLNPYAPIAGFWRRFAAFILDTLLLGLIGQGLAWSASSFWFQVGPHGRVVGVLVTALYFGILNSRLGGGQTLGKRLMGIAVRGPDNQPIGVGRALLRTTIVFGPSYLNGWPLPFLDSPVMTNLVMILVTGLGSAVLITMVFNRKVRQGLHDMLCKTYVIRKATPVTLPLPATSRRLWITAGATILVAIIGIAALNLWQVSLLSPTGPLASVQPVYATLSQDARFFSFRVEDQIQTGSNRATQRILRIDGWYRGRASEAEQQKLINELAAIALQSTKDINDFDAMSITITSAFNLGIASGNFSYGDIENIPVWRTRVQQSAGVINSTPF